MKIKNLKNQKAFTLIELLVVIAIISILASILFVAIDPAEQSKKAKDAQRLSDMKNIEKALELYLIDNGHYPANSDNNCAGWDVGNKLSALIPGGLDSYMKVLPVDNQYDDECSGYRYYRYPAGSYGCDASKGAFYILLATGVKGNSPGWSCPDRNWSSGVNYWVTGHFEY